MEKNLSQIGKELEKISKGQETVWNSQVCVIEDRERIRIKIPVGGYRIRTHR